ncbi:ABC transporter ATP-binding protein [Vallitalea longa]|uniref:ABC transporter ATP-binding protein n=1 Tax=Vallitalea longa TaxID=2936439 RepID=A0A9W5YEF2_9FIRM|nr:energy-coupling factor ABC transporter ATP-binding protein [Vallitalea longa]GKX31010.1 ABC transporter ATP-binding protein [Vallitalea longa]
MTIIRADNIYYGYKKNSSIIKGLSLEIDNNITALIGENGSGKTTLGKLLCGIFKPTQGTVYINNEPTNNMSLGEIGKTIGYLFQNPNRQIFALTVKEQMLFVDQIMDKDDIESKTRMENILNYFDLHEKLNEYTYRLSQGEKQRLALASIILSNPRYLILDEPTTGLDIIRKQRLADYIKDIKVEDIGILIISHDMEFVNENADRIITLSKGEIIHDTK